MEPRKIIDYGTYCVFIESMSRHLKLRIGEGTRSFSAILTTLDIRKLAYALLLEADTLDSEIVKH